MWALGAVLYFIVNKGKHLFQSAFEVGAWKGGDSLNCAIYSIDLMQLMSALLHPKPKLRPTAEQVTSGTKKENRCYDQA